MSVANLSVVSKPQSKKTASKVRGNFMKDLGGKFMKDPLSKIQLSEGIALLNPESGDQIGEVRPYGRDTSR